MLWEWEMIVGWGRVGMIEYWRNGVGGRLGEFEVRVYNCVE